MWLLPGRPFPFSISGFHPVRVTLYNLTHEWEANATTFGLAPGVSWHRRSTVGPILSASENQVGLNLSQGWTIPVCVPEGRRLACIVMLFEVL